MENQDILTNIRRLLRSINLESKRIQKEFGVSIPQILCLNFLAQQTGFASTVKDIAESMKLNPSSASGIVKRLEAKGFVAKLPHPTDQRSSIIALTKAGSDILNSTPDLFHEKLERKLKAIPEDKRLQIRSGLEELIRILEIDTVDASPLVAAETSVSGSETA